MQDNNVTKIHDATEREKRGNKRNIIKEKKTVEQYS